ncbi:hypothetical protein P73_1363 [Celeribacter indicus]|uniref:Uncharacterized protein n=1 Tax=Celeribacter indicus TaxID=1208324 RepID=A0A0B5DRC2_9RHOB|nr:hypothetical protein P73_1363 [Celeribacter indicus]
MRWQVFDLAALFRVLRFFMCDVQMRDRTFKADGRCRQIIDLVLAAPCLDGNQQNISGFIVQSAERIGGKPVFNDPIHGHFAFLLRFLMAITNGNSRIGARRILIFEFFVEASQHAGHVGEILIGCFCRLSFLGPSCLPPPLVFASLGPRNINYSQVFADSFDQIFDCPQARGSPQAHLLTTFETVIIGRELFNMVNEVRQPQLWFLNHPKQRGGRHFIRCAICSARRFNTPQDILQR